jgi:hypothetical protein
MPVLGPPVKVASENSNIKDSAPLAPDFPVVNSTRPSMQTAVRNKSANARVPEEANRPTGAPPSSLGSSFVYPPQWRHGQIPKFPQGKIAKSKLGSYFVFGLLITS